jgi:uncharacterized protein (DUF1778 family)
MSQLLQKRNHAEASRRTLSATEILCLVTLLLVMGFVGKHLLGKRVQAARASDTGPSEQGLSRASGKVNLKPNLVYQPASHPSATRAPGAAFDAKEKGDTPGDENAGKLIQLLPVKPGEEDPLIHQSVLDPGPAQVAAKDPVHFSSGKATSSNAVKAYRDAKLNKADRRRNGQNRSGEGRGSVVNARGKASRDSTGLADNRKGDTLSLEPEIIDPQVQLNSFYEALKNPQVSNGNLRRFMENLTAAEIPAALEAVNQLEASSRTSYAVEELFRAWAKTDPLQALDYADEYLSIRTRNSAISNTLGTWAKKQPHQALDWYLENLETDPRAKQLSIGHVFRELARVDMNDAIQNARSLPDERMRHSAFNYILESIDRDERQATLDSLYQNAVNSNERKSIANLVVQHQVRYDPYEAARYVTTLDDPVAQQSALNSLVSSWSMDRPDQAAAFITRLDDAKLRDKHLGSTMRNWVRYDPEMALNWLDEQTPAGDLDSAYGSVVYNFRSEDPEEALYWAEQIQDEKKQSSTIRMVAREWLKTDLSRARDYIARSPAFSEKDRARYLGTPLVPKPQP